MRNRQFVFAPKIQYKLAAERHAYRQAGSEAGFHSLQFPQWCPREDSNPYLLFRRQKCYPLHYEGFYL